MQGISLRAAAKRLGYAPSSLHQAKGEGHFHELPGGGYDLQEVAQGLLDNSSPRGEHREHLELIAAGGFSQSEPEFSPQVEAAIRASSDLCHTPEADEAFVTLARLPRKMAQSYHAHAPLKDLAGSEKWFFDAVQQQLRWWFENIDAPELNEQA